MKKLLLILLINFVFLFASSISLHSQTYIWGGPGDVNSEFNGGLNDWTINAVSPNANALWIWEEDGKADNGKWWYNRNPIESPSISNGAMVFDSDFYETGGQNGNHGDGIAPDSQTGELISPSFSCENHESVWIQFNQFYRKYHSTPLISVSIDEGQSWSDPIEINKDVRVNNSTRNNSLKFINISDIAANQQNVKIKFIWKGSYYFWIIDDVYIVSEPETDPQITGTWYPPNSFKTPLFLISNDSMRFKMEVINKGGKNSKNIKATTSIVHANLLTTYYNDTTFFDLNSGDTTNITFKSYMPEREVLDTGLYLAIYKIEPTEIAATIDYKEIHQYFRITPNNAIECNNKEDSESNTEYSLIDDNTDGSYSYQGSGSAGPIYSVFNINVYKTSDWIENDCISIDASSAFLSLSMVTNSNTDKISFPFNVYLLEVNDTIDRYLNNLNANSGLIVDGNDNEQLKYIGYAVEQINNVDQNKRIEVTLISTIDDTDNVKLNPNRLYLICALWKSGIRYYQGNDNHYRSIPRYHYPDQLVSLRHGDYGDGPGFYNISRDVGAWDLGMKLKLAILNSNPTDEKLFPNNSISLESNPVDKQLKIKYDFENNIEKATMLIHNINGDVIDIKNEFNLKNGNINFNVSNLASGMYIFTIYSKNKMISKKFLVQH